MPPGLHWVKVVDPVNWDLPDHVSIVKSARVDLLYSKHVMICYIGYFSLTLIILIVDCYHEDVLIQG